MQVQLGKQTASLSAGKGQVHVVLGDYRELFVVQFVRLDRHYVAEVNHLSLVLVQVHRLQRHLVVCYHHYLLCR